MKSPPAYLAFDLGAESGRVVLGRLREDRLELQEIHRFQNGPLQAGGSLYWDILRLWKEMKKGLQLALHEAGGSLISVGVDSWGVDFGLLDARNALIETPRHYRDPRTNGILESVSKLIPLVEIYEQTGVQIMEINSLYQLLSMVLAKSPHLQTAESFLTIPDLFNFWLSGVKASEYSIATTTQCVCPFTSDWAWGMIERLQIPTRIFGEIVPAGTVLGKLEPLIAAEMGSKDINVIAVASHDTQSAIAAIPTRSNNYAYLSSGTWSLMGVEMEQPIITERSRAYQLSNEAGFGKKICFLKNIPGLWLLQECRHEWTRQGRKYSYEELTQMAEKAAPLKSFITPSDPVFMAPGDMAGRIQSACLQARESVPEQPAEIVRCILDSLALEYRSVLEQISELSGLSIPVIHVTGGGSQNALLNQFTADATGRMVIAGPVEATAMGNILVQAIAAGQVASLAEGRSLIQRSVETRKFVPVDPASWDHAYDRYLKLRKI